MTIESASYKIKEQKNLTFLEAFTEDILEIPIVSNNNQFYISYQRTKSNNEKKLIAVHLLLKHF